MFAADFRDRIVHHLLVEHLERYFEPRFIHDSYACRRGKGTLAASDRLMDLLRRATVNGQREAWAIQLDVASFFPSIHKDTLFAMIARFVRDPELRWLTEVVLFHDPTTNYRFHCKERAIPAPGTAGYPVPPYKSLFGNGNERGLPIGNLTSQVWANVYLNELDQFIKRRLKCHSYLRYVDDLVLLHHDPQVLRQWREAIAEFASQRLRLSLREPRVEPVVLSGGIDFVGWRTWWSHRVPRRRTMRNLEARLLRFERLAIRSGWGGRARVIDVLRPESNAQLQAIGAVLASYGGHLKHSQSWAEWKALLRGFDWLPVLYRVQGWSCRERWVVSRLLGGRLSHQYRLLLRGAGAQTLIFFHVGKFIEFYGPQRLMAQRAFGLVVAQRPRAGFGLTVGFPARRAATYEQRALRAGLHVVHVRRAAENRNPTCELRGVARIAMMPRGGGERLR